MPVLLGSSDKFLFLTFIFHLVHLVFMFSSMDNITSYKAVLVVVNNFAQFLTAQITTVEKVLSCKVMVKDGGFETRSTVKEQV
ncbi:hypothetical protein BpHYR1_047152 [Brachionus plicatilis]|uniref:Uncharacterized protein n=1 Tax=Brachionus plicatilis TaxID=10195 RepID=A0A3M7P5U3_BRAPC|nr:hypothetical protein BpHYR1_047152 [Brachionus plicatilis]